jgi:hypothetical protein
LLSLGLLTGLTGCYDNFETVTVQTTAAGAMVAGAQCNLSNKKGQWLVITPGSVSVHLGSEPLDVKCAKDGYEVATQKANSSPNFDAILLDGAAFTTISGSAWIYPQMITVPMQSLPATPSPTS